MSRRVPIGAPHVRVGRQRDRDRDRAEQLPPTDKDVGPIAGNNDNDSYRMDIDDAFGFVVVDADPEPLTLETLEILEDNDVVPDLQEF